jgi:hypothetical protein
VCQQIKNKNIKFIKSKKTQKPKPKRKLKERGGFEKEYQRCSVLASAKKYPQTHI